jgi:hypothetical protein
MYSAPDSRRFMADDDKARVFPSSPSKSSKNGESREGDTMAQRSDWQELQQKFLALQTEGRDGLKADFYHYKLEGVVVKPGVPETHTLAVIVPASSAAAKGLLKEWATWSISGTPGDKRLRAKFRDVVERAVLNLDQNVSGDEAEALWCTLLKDSSEGYIYTESVGHSCFDPDFEPGRPERRKTYIVTSSEIKRVCEVSADLCERMETKAMKVVCRVATTAPADQVGAPLLRFVSRGKGVKVVENGYSTGELVSTVMHLRDLLSDVRSLVRQRPSIDAPELKQTFKATMLSKLTDDSDWGVWIEGFAFDAKKKKITLEGCAYSLLAPTLGISASTLKTQFCRARKAIGSGMAEK